jgi:Tol biopolymer transport system component
MKRSVQFVIICLCAMSFMLSACTAPQVKQGTIQVQLTADGKTIPLEIPAGSTVRDALDAARVTAQVTTNDNDYTLPPEYTLLEDGSEVRIVRVLEEYTVEQVVIPFEHQEVRNESLPAGTTRLTQPGVNGLQENTYRRVLEDGIEKSNTIVRSVIVQEPVAEIVMVGSQTPFASMTIPGRIVYLMGGNAWVMEGTTANRRPVVTTGDLDGQIFSLSPDGNWLIFTRYAEDVNQINALWAARIDDETGLLVDLQASNIVHFADWAPGLSIAAYSTVEPRSTAPGWQANNDLYVVGVSESGYVTDAREELEANSGGVYGWWGMNFRWNPDGVRLAYSRPDGVGILDTRQEGLSPLLDILPLQSGGDWAWEPGAAWGPDGKSIYTVDHVAPPGSVSPEKSPHFDLTALPLEDGAPVHLVSDVGMFSYPEPSPMIEKSILVGDEFKVESYYQIAYLQAIFPTQSDSSAYRLAVMDRDGSNRKELFPEAGASGLDPQRVVWSPSSIDIQSSLMIAVVYQGNIWFINPIDGQARQVTGDGMTVRIDWK